MKEFFRIIVTVLLPVSLITCGRDSDPLNPDSIEELVPPTQNLVDFTLEKTDIKIYKKGKSKIKITSGNGDYDIRNGSAILEQPIILAEVSKDKQYIEITGINEGGTKITIIDTKSQKTIDLLIIVVEEKTPYADEMSLLDFSDATPKKYISQTKGAIEKYNELKRELDRYPELPKDPIYKAQNDTYADGVKIYTQKINNFKNYTEQTDIKILRNIYVDISTYGVGYSYIELMCRRAVKYQKEFPNDTRIPMLIKDLIEANYTSQEGNDFIHGVNNETVINFNKIVDIVNELKLK